MARQTKERAEQTRETILDAAEQVFFKRGVARASIEEIAAEAGVTRGAVYFHFRDKVDLFLGIEERVRLPHEEIMAMLAQSPTADALNLLERIVLSLFARYAAEDRKRIRLTVLLLRCDYVDEMAPALDRQNATYGRFAIELRRYFRDAARGPNLDQDWNPELAALVFQTLMHGALLRWLRSPGDFPLNSSGVSVVKGFLTAVRRNWAPTDGQTNV